MSKGAGLSTCYTSITLVIPVSQTAETEICFWVKKKKKSFPQLLEWILKCYSSFSYAPGIIRSWTPPGFYYNSCLRPRVSATGGTWVFDFHSLKSKQEISQLNRLSDWSDFLSSRGAFRSFLMHFWKRGFAKSDSWRHARTLRPATLLEPFFMYVTEEKEKKRQGEEEITEPAKWKLLSCSSKRRKKKEEIRHRGCAASLIWINPFTWYWIIWNHALNLHLTFHYTVRPIVTSISHSF